MNLTARQSEFIDIISGYQLDNDGAAPTLRELSQIADVCECSAKRMLVRLEEKGALIRTSKKYRNIQLTEDVELMNRHRVTKAQTLTQAQRLADSINAYWRSQGYEANARPALQTNPYATPVKGTSQMSLTEFWVVKSDLVGGKPKSLVAR